VARALVARVARAPAVRVLVARVLAARAAHSATLVRRNDKCLIAGE
jgi:hypothetical protein